MGKIFCVEFRMFLLKFHTKSYQYNERCVVYWWVKIYELLDLRARKCLWNAPQVSHGHWLGIQHNYEIYFCSSWPFCQSKCSFVGLAHRSDKPYLFFGKSLLQRTLFCWPVCSPPYYPSHHSSDRKLARLFEGPRCELSAKMLTDLCVKPVGMWNRPEHAIGFLAKTTAHIYDVNLYYIRVVVFLKKT